MEITYKKLTEKELDTFIEMRIHQLREEGAKEDCEGMQTKRNSQRTSITCCGGSQSVWMWNCTDYGIGYGGIIVYGLWI